MKGQEPLLATTILLALTASVIGVFGATAISSSVDFGIENNARLQALKLVSLLNAMQFSPNDVSTVLDLPKTKCLISINEFEVRYKTLTTQNEEEVAINVIQTRVSIPKKTLTCDDETIKIRKRGNEIQIQVVHA